MAWLYLIAAGLADVAWTSLLKYHGFSKPGWLALIGFLVLIVPVLVAMALKTVPLGTSYVVWMGLGAIGTFIVGIFLFHESASITRIICAGLILAGIIGLKLADGNAPGS